MKISNLVKFGKPHKLNFAFVDLWGDLSCWQDALYHIVEEVQYVHPVMKSELVIFSVLYVAYCLIMMPRK